MNQHQNAPIRTPWETPPDIGGAIEVAEGVLWIRLPLPMKLDHINVFALDEGDHWTIVDTGFYSQKGVEIWEQVLAGPLAGKPVGRVVVTHHHPDHIGMAGWFMERFGAELVMTRVAWLTARMLRLDVQERPPAETLRYWRLMGMDPEIYDQRAHDRPFNTDQIVYDLPLGFTRIRQDDVIRIGGRDWDVHTGDGHAPEMATFWSRDDRLVLGADQLLPSISPNLGIYPTELEANPVVDFMTCCEALIPLANDDHLVLPGHKLVFTGLPARLKQLVDHHNNALDRLHAWLETPATTHQSMPTLFKRTIKGGEYGLALVEAAAHMNALHQSGRVDRWIDDETGAYMYKAT
jgi:glyoxylase-like metal-dependent hydrolase (beta-lactamase superfamily II)